MIRASFRISISKRGLWTLEAVHRQIAVLPRQAWTQQDVAPNLASAFNKSRAFLAGVMFLVPGNGNEQHDRDKSSAI
jgi:hypothetical protein